MILFFSHLFMLLALNISLLIPSSIPVFINLLQPNLMVNNLEHKDQWKCDQKNKYQEMTSFLAKRIGIKGDIKLVRSNNHQPAGALGHTFWLKKAYILIDPLSSFIDKPRFILAHELAHLKNNDMTLGSLVNITIRFITLVSLAILFPHSLFLSPSLNLFPSIIAHFLSKIAVSTIRQVQEETADRIAFSLIATQYGNKLAKQEVNSFIKELRSYQIIERVRRKYKFFTNEQGDPCWEFFEHHPSYSKRIRYLTDLCYNS